MQMPECHLPNARTACNNYESIHEVDFHDIKNPAALLSYPNPMRTQVYTCMRLIDDNPHSRDNIDKNPLRCCQAGSIGEYSWKLVCSLPEEAVGDRIRPMNVEYLA
ncbi:unnamed protein product [Schistosoma mattheei]|uniref:Uncharacterized protein n=1 Tax=Schistosoma mattheei TaxID=31246 RepID=A0A183Q077_9TREM|nr:unnamed protein product [Schistosoma mattheei]